VVLTDPQIALVREMAQAKVQLDRATARMEELKARARDTLPMGKSEAFEHVTVVLSRNRTWNKDKALESYGDEICSMQVDLDKARAVMTGDTFESFYKEGPPKVEVKIT
jgi:hypothetical protein